MMKNDGGARKISGHTNGTWTTWYSDGNWYVGPDADGEALFVGKRENQPNGDCSPDAHLIAAAPDLLEALESLVLFTNPKPANALALHNAYRVIAKARGQK